MIAGRNIFVKAFGTGHVLIFAILTVKCGWWAPIFAALTLIWIALLWFDPAAGRKKLGNCAVCAYVGQTEPATRKVMTNSGEIRAVCETCAKANEFLREAAAELNHGTAFSA